MKDTQLASSLREKLGADSAGQWIDFMDSLGSSLPFLLRSAGRPTGAEIASSPIGAGGFTSWRQMVETSPGWGGLGWSYDTYKAWKKAYAVVQKHPYLRDLMLSSSEINRIQRENKPFPASLEELQSLKEKRKDAQEEQRLNSMKALQAQLSTAKKEAAALQQALETSRVSADQFKSESNKLRQELSQLSEQKGALQVQVKTLETTVKEGSERIQELEKADEMNNSVRVAHSIFKKYIENLWRFSRSQLFAAFVKGHLPRPLEVSQTVREQKSPQKKKVKIRKS